MRKLVVSVLVIAMTITCSLAQSNKEEVDLFQAALGMQKKEAFTKFIKLEGVQKDAFWTLYDEYEGKRKALGKRRITLLENYVAGYETMDDASTAQTLKDMIAIGKDTDNLTATYANKMKKGAGVKAAAQFYQLESYITSVVRATILDNIPFIGEFDKK